MNDYKITYIGETGESYKAYVTERTESSARKSFNSAHKGMGFTIQSVELHEENTCATKQQERETLEAIRKMVTELGPHSYLSSAFQGCFEIAEQNIEYDFGDSMKGQVEVAERKAESLESQVKELEGKLHREIEEKQQARGEAQAVIKKLEAKILSDEDLERVIAILGDQAEEAESKAEKDAAEIVRLAEDPNSGGFRKAVAMNRNHSTYAKICQELMDRVAAVRAAAHAQS